jgi:primary-amine oxidase
MQKTEAARATAQHPLEPLSATEIAAATAVLRREHDLAAIRVHCIGLLEPAKAAVLAWPDGGAIEREAFCILRDHAQRATIEAVVSLSRDSIVSWREVPGVQPSIHYEEALAAERVVKQNADWQAAMRRRGVEQFDLAMIDEWSAGNYGEPEQDPAQHRVVNGLTWIRSSPTDNGYARPIEGLLTLVDLDSMTVIAVRDHGVVPLPEHPGNFTSEGIADPRNVPHVPAPRADLRPLMIHQPDGPSFSVEGHEVRWQKWRMRLGFTSREGLVLHTVAYEDGGRLRPILYRASLSEMVVPYGDPAPTHWRKNAFDEGEYGLGMLANALELGCDCLGEIRYFDAVLALGDGSPVTLTNAICLHEEDFGVLWKHRDGRAGVSETRRSRRLVISFVATVANYEYGFYWYFYQDGSIQFEVKLTGIISTGAIAPGETPAHGQLVAPGLYGPHHQHVFNVRLDMTVDGPQNTVHELDSVALPRGPENPQGNAWIVQQTPLRSESAGARLLDPWKARAWLVVNEQQRNLVGGPTGYKLVPGDNTLPFAQPDASVMQRAAFMTRHLWVTAYDPAELYAAGDYPNQHAGGAGLPSYIAQNRPLENADLVLWYTLNHHHVVRPEEWPVAPVATIGFKLLPCGFFDGNPALDVPPAAGHCD